MNSCRGRDLAGTGLFIKNAQLNAGSFRHLQRLKRLKCAFREYRINESDHNSIVTLQSRNTQ